MSLAQNIALQELRPDETPSRAPEASNVDIETTVAEPTDRAPQESESMWRPSRQYQAILLLAGFTMTFHVIRINSIYCIFQEFYTSSSTNIDDARGQDALVSLVGTIGTGLTWSGSIYASPLFGRGARKRHPHPPRAMTEPTPGPVIPPSEAKRAKEFVTTEY